MTTQCRVISHLKKNVKFTTYQLFVTFCSQTIETKAIKDHPHDHEIG